MPLRFLLPVIVVLLNPVLALRAQQPEEEAASGPWPALAKPAQTDESSQKILALHLQARGGRAALEAVRGLLREGELTEGQKDYSLTVVWGFPASMREESDRFFRGYNYITLRGTDGVNAWSQETGPKRKNPQKVGGQDKQLLELDAMLPFLLLDPSACGALFAYKGEETFAKRPAYVLHGWLANGLRLEVLLDSQSFHVINYRHIYRIGGQDVLIDRVPTGLTKVGDTWWETGCRYLYQGKAFREIKWFKVEGRATAGADAFKEPPTYERWLRGDSAKP